MSIIKTNVHQPQPIRLICDPAGIETVMRITMARRLKRICAEVEHILPSQHLHKYNIKMVM